MSEKRVRKILTEEQKVGLILIFPPLLLITVFFLKPLLETCWLSFSYKNLLRPHAPNRFVGLENYTWMVQSPMFWGTMARTLIYTVSVSAVSIITGLVVALLMNCEFKGKSIAFALVMLPWVTSDMVASFVFTWIFDLGNGILNYLMVDVLHLMKAPVVWLGEPKLAMISAIAVAVWRFLPFTILVLLAALKQVPPELVDAARIDGAGSIGVFRNVTLPTIKGPLLVLIIFRFAAVFRTFEGIYLLTRGGPGDATNVLSIWYYKTGFEAFKLGNAAAIAMLIVALSAAVYLTVTKVGKDEAI